MKKVSFIFLLFLNSAYSHSQTIYSDALYLKSKIDPDIGNKIILNKDVKQLLMLYYPGTNEDDIDTVLLNSNPFFKKLFVPKALLADNTRFKPLSTSSIGGLDVTNIANGVAQFMIKRAKEELTVAFFNRFKKFAEANPEFKILFPKTTDNLAKLLTYKYPEMLSALRTGFFEDLKNIPYHLDDVFEMPKYHELLKNFPEIRIAIRTIRIVHEIEAGDSHPAVVLSKFAEFKEWDDPHASKELKNFGYSIKLAAVFSNSLRTDSITSADSSRAWITFKQLETLVKDSVFFKIYMGLVYQTVKNKEIRFYTKSGSIIKFEDIIEKQKDDLFLFENKLTEFVELANKVDELVDSIKVKRPAGNSLTNDDYYDYIDASLDVIEYGFSIAKLFDDSLRTDEYTVIGRKANDLYRNIYKEEYNQAVTNAMDILSAVNVMVDENKKSVMSNKQNVELLNSQLKSFSGFNETILKLTKYGLFMANMVEAKSSQEVASVLENAVLPVGSSSIKKYAHYNIAVQSYLGAYTRIGTIKNNTTNSWNDQWGIIAPIGLSFSHGFKKSGSISLFTSLFDLGAIVDYQLKKDSVPNTNTEEITKDYKVELGQIFSPGAYFVYGFCHNIPLSLGFGGQYGPGLGKIEQTGTTTVINPQWRWNIFLAVDIPFFNLVNRNDK